MTITEIINLINRHQNAENIFVNVSVEKTHDDVSYILYRDTFLFFDKDKLDFINRHGHIVLTDNMNKANIEAILWICWE